jgi:hypothetical protein
VVRACFVIVLILTLGTANAAQFTAQLDKHETTLGEPLMLRLQSTDAKASVADLDLSPLRRDFEVFASSHTRADELRSGRLLAVDTLEVTLYPLHAGQLAIPPLTLGLRKSRPLVVTVAADPELAVRTFFTPDELFERQQGILTIELRDQGQYQWSPPTNLAVPDLQFRPLNEFQHEERTARGPAIVHRFRWAALPLRADRYLIKLPMLDGYKLGTRLRLPLSPVALYAQALPAYLPVAVPIGKPRLRLEPLLQQGTLDQPFTWTIRVTADGITADGLRQLLRIPEGEQACWLFYHAQASLEEDSNTGARTIRLDVPMKPLQAGDLTLPNLRLPYFDTQLQRVGAVQIKGPELRIVNPPWERMRVAGAAIVALALAGLAGWRLGHLWRQHLERQSALKRIREAADVAELVHAIRAFASAPEPLTLDQWARRYGADAKVRDLVQQLRDARYGQQQQADLEDLKRHWLAALSRAKPGLI